MIILNAYLVGVAIGMIFAFFLSARNAAKYGDDGMLLLLAYSAMAVLWPISIPCWLMTVLWFRFYNRYKSKL